MEPDRPTSLLEHMKQRQEERAERNKQRRLESEIQGLESRSQAEYFNKTFQGMRSRLEEKVQGVETVGKEEMTDFFDGLVKDVQDMQQLLNESSMYLASFQQKKAQEEVNEVNTLVQQAILEHQPKKKFGFGRKKASEKPKKADTLPRDSADGQIKSSTALDDLVKQQYFGFRDEADQTLTKSPDELENRQLNLQNLRNCKIMALGNPGTLQAASLQDCTVIAGPTSRSIFIKDCSACTFIIACQQVRIHNTSDTQFYLHVTGAAIIEGCQGVSFAPYNLCYPGLEEHYISSGLNCHINHWDKVDDFHWLNEDEKSPNWSIIPEDERLGNWLE